VIGGGLQFIRGSREGLLSSLAAKKAILYVFWKASRCV
jgi:hypothetical protein